MTEFPVHPALAVFPRLDGTAFAELAEGIKARGQLMPVLVAGGWLVDGRARIDICRQLGIEPRFVELADRPESGLVELVIDANLRRRQLDESQRAMIAARLATLRHGGARRGAAAGFPAPADVGVQAANLPLETTAQMSFAMAAGLLNVGVRSARSAREVLAHGRPELVAAVERGQVAVSAAASAARLAPEQQSLFLVGVIENKRRPALVQREITRDLKLAAIEGRAIRGEGARGQVIDISRPGARTYSVLYADPPWPTESYSDKGLERSPEMHYPTMPLDEIKRMGVARVATADAALFCWAKANYLPEAIEVVRAWGFRYVTHIVWDKGRVGTGFWVRDRHEILMIAKRGAMPAPLPGTQPESLIAAPKGAHSAKPDRFRGIIAQMYPECRKLELFARGPVPAGWDAWGNEAGSVDAAVAEILAADVAADMAEGAA